VKNSIETSGHV